MGASSHEWPLEGALYKIIYDKGYSDISGVVCLIRPCIPVFVHLCRVYRKHVIAELVLPEMKNKETSTSSDYFISYLPTETLSTKMHSYSTRGLFLKQNVSRRTLYEVQ